MLVVRLNFQWQLEGETYEKYDTPAPVSLNYYVLFQYTLCLIGTGLFLFKQSNFLIGEKIFFTVIISIVVVNCGVLFENKPWVRMAEWIRIVAYPLILIAFTFIYFWPPALVGVAVVYLLISGSWFYSITKNVQLQAV